MNKFTQYIPGFARDDRDEPFSAEFEALEELLNIPHVKRWSKDRDFNYYALSDKHYLMAVLNDGFEWWVVGRIEHPVDGIVEWDGGKYLMVDRLGMRRAVAGKDVKWSDSTGRIVLKSGEEGRRINVR